ncbi:MAG: 50S ribosomal protein L33 [Deltaproteobacteria bacterium]|nr:50S ribosomal protein L33 [Deltaproteobacteria bacterium]
MAATGRVAIVLACSECAGRNYRTTRARKAGAKPLELKKFCPRCNRHTLHRESK